MPGDLAIDSVTQAAYPPGTAYPSATGRTPSGSTPVAAEQAVPAAAAAKTTAVELANPRLHTDVALNRLVLEFFDSRGDLTQSIPNQKQLDAYRLAAASGARDTVEP